jgi:acyl-CoA dehydrogenase
MASMISPTTSSISCWHGCPMRRLAPAASRCFWCRSSSSTKTARSGARNDVFCNGLEHKLGIHASPTCTMIYGDGKHRRQAGAVGWLVGEENRGLACMFTMMNNARLAVGMQGVAIAEAAYQKALAYANERTQGRAPGWDGDGMSPIIDHPDVQRMLLTMKALTQGARAICYACAEAIDMSRVANGRGSQRFWNERAGLLTPIAKAFSTDIGSEVASLGVQVHGGMGFIEESRRRSACMRDARITPIYEGTNGIQAIDLVMRKLPLSGGAAVKALISDFKADAEAARACNAPSPGDGVAEHLDAGDCRSRNRDRLSPIGDFRRPPNRCPGRSDTLSAAVRPDSH